MSDKELDTLKRLSDAVPLLNKEERHYILGVAEGMAMAKEFQKPAETEASTLSTMSGER